jgi:hypothetical protein
MKKNLLLTKLLLFNFALHLLVFNDKPFINNIKILCKNIE